MTIIAFSWLVAWVRALTALERATRMALIASTLPSRTFGTTDARPDSAARAAGLTTRTAAESADATRRWDDERGQPLLTKGPTRE